MVKYSRKGTFGTALTLTVDTPLATFWTPASNVKEYDVCLFSVFLGKICFLFTDLFSKYIGNIIHCCEGLPLLGVGNCVMRKQRINCVVSLLPMRPKARGLSQHGGPPGWQKESGLAECILYVIDGPSRQPWRTTPHAPVWGWSITKCTQNTVISCVTQGRHGLVL